jgi:hypothetical protein
MDGFVCVQSVAPQNVYHKNPRAWTHTRCSGGRRQHRNGGGKYNWGSEEDGVGEGGEKEEVAEGGEEGEEAVVEAREPEPEPEPEVGV